MDTPETPDTPGMTDAELHRAVVGLLALTYNETHGGSSFSSTESVESLMTLFSGLHSSLLSVDFDPDEDLTSIVAKVAQASVDMMMVQTLRALNVAGLAFVEFCDLVEQEAPSIDIDAMIKHLALLVAEDED